MDAAALGLGVGDDVVGDAVVVAAVDGDVVGQHRQFDGVEGEGVVVVGVDLRPHGQAVVAGLEDPEVDGVVLVAGRDVLAVGAPG